MIAAACRATLRRCASLLLWTGCFALRGPPRGVRAICPGRERGTDRHAIRPIPTFPARPSQGRRVAGKRGPFPGASTEFVRHHYHPRRERRDHLRVTRGIAGAGLSARCADRQDAVRYLASQGRRARARRIRCVAAWPGAAIAAAAALPTRRRFLDSSGGAGQQFAGASRYPWHRADLTRHHRAKARRRAGAVPGQLRCAYRPAQPLPHAGSAHASGGAGASQPPAGRRYAHRPGPLQGSQ